VQLQGHRPADIFGSFCELITVVVFVEYRLAQHIETCIFTFFLLFFCLMTIYVILWIFVFAVIATEHDKRSV